MEDIIFFCMNSENKNAFQALAKEFSILGPYDNLNDAIYMWNDRGAKVIAIDVDFSFDAPNGKDFFAWVRGNDFFDGVKVAFFCSDQAIYADEIAPQAQAKWKSLGVSDYLIAPMSAEDFRQRINSLIVH